MPPLTKGIYFPPPRVILTLGERLRRSMAVPLFKSRQRPLQNVHKFQRTQKCNEFCRHIIAFWGIKEHAHSVGWGRGSSLNFAFQQGGGGHVLIVPIKSLKIFSFTPFFIN